MSGVLGRNLARSQLEKFIDRPKKHFSVTIFNNVDWGGDRQPLPLLPLALLKGD
ncbi:hypothetical protein [Nostoc sp.]|uniref:hypothetical protein n=1 Tax=Nostoc sp. TaxID=1180 RepID=UPI002FFA8703